MNVLYELYTYLVNTYTITNYSIIDAFIDKYYYLYYTYACNFTLVFTFKLALCLSFLIFIRGGVPRYRYDFLTKIGWVKFLGYVISIFLLSFLFCIVL
jgi:NADH:ubiquinone oxidoreductase subunit H